MDEYTEVEIIRNGEQQTVYFCDLSYGDYIPVIGETVDIGAHYSGDASYDGWLFYDQNGNSWFPEDVA